MRARRVAVGVVAGAMLAATTGACVKQEQSNDGVNPERPLWVNRPSGSMRVFARRPLTAASRTVGEDYERGRAEIDVANGRIFLGSADRGM